MGEHVTVSSHKSSRLAEVLVFEDSDTDAHVIEQILLKRGVEGVARVKDANDWERWVEHYQPRVILMDVVMPGKSGYEAMRELKRHPVHSGIPVVICTSRHNDADMVWATKLGASGFVAKPLNDPKELILAIRSADKNARKGQSLDFQF